MRQRLDELRQVRKEAAVITIDVCCGVPGLFCVKNEKIFTTNKFRLPDLKIVARKESFK